MSIFTVGFLTHGSIIGYLPGISFLRMSPGRGGGRWVLLTRPLQIDRRGGFKQLAVFYGICRNKSTVQTFLQEVSRERVCVRVCVREENQ